MAKDEKYKWDIGAGIYPSIDPHSKIKHKIIQDYIRSYITVVMSNQQIPRIGINIVDGFCGGGLYKDFGQADHYGSPIIVLDSVKETIAEINVQRKSPREVLTQNFFIDIQKNNIKYLEAVLNTKGYSHRLGKDVFTLCSSFTDALPSVLKKIKEFRFSERSLFLLDQYAYKDVPFSSIRTIFNSVANAEVLLTFNVDSLIDYLSDREQNRKALQNIDLEKYIPWEKLHSYKATMRREWQHLIQRFLAKGILKESGADYMTVFFITPSGPNPRTYWFIHLAKSYKANAVMKEIHWRYGNNFSHSMTPALFVGYDANRDIQLTDQIDLSFGEEHNFDNVTNKRIENELSIFLPRKIYDQTHQSFANMMMGLANNTMADESIVKQSLHGPIVSGDIVVYDKDNRTRRRKGSSIKSSDIIAPSPQRTMFFFPPTSIL
ncbi:three-Cys-motif partner protein TcmP [Pseudomonas brassicacearum subsp. neoaurantiaca]|uniref:three-Cys-motif partner protein TcmP n=1 Tax=Pseudomonas brassicacearum TaxID=930166 RepID=UPI004036C58F